MLCFHFLDLLILKLCVCGWLPLYLNTQKSKLPGTLTNVPIGGRHVRYLSVILHWIIAKNEQMGQKVVNYEEVEIKGRATYSG